VRRRSWADTGCSVAWDPHVLSIRRWSGTDGHTPLQIHKRKHQPVSRTRTRGREGSLQPNSGYRNAITCHTTSWISVCTRSSTSYRAQSMSTAVVQSSWALREVRVHADVDRGRHIKQWGAGKRRDGIREAGAGHAEPACQRPGTACAYQIATTGEGRVAQWEGRQVGGSRLAGKGRRRAGQGTYTYHQWERAQPVTKDPSPPHARLSEALQSLIHT
jgi:hypothetical protein